MSNDLEAEIREALHSRAQTVTGGDLRRGGESRSSSRRNLVAALATAAVVAALAIGVGIVVWPNSDHHGSPAAGPVSVAGTDWQFLRGIQGTTNFSTPGRHVHLAFYDNGTYGADDSVNGHGGTYRQTPSGIEFSSGTTTMVLYAGDDPNVVATQFAFTSMLSGRSPVRAELNDAGELVLSGSGYSLWFRSAGPVDTPTTHASPTSTRTS